MSSTEPQEGAVSGRASRGMWVVACEDQPLMREYLRSGLARLGIDCAGVCDGPELDAHLAAHPVDIVILDIGLPGEDGYSIATRLRGERPHLGIVMLTARDQTQDRVQGLDCGADLYFAKPVDIRELASALGSLKRRLSLTRPAPPQWRLDLVRSRLIAPSGAEVGLTDSEFRFLCPLLERPGMVIDRDPLCQLLHQSTDIYAMRRMETMLSRLRAKVLRECPGEPLPVRARHGRGYAFLGEAESARPAPPHDPGGSSL
jgi:DNA-binding response OmpR family regulator